MKHLSHYVFIKIQSLLFFFFKRFPADLYCMHKYLAFVQFNSNYDYKIEQLLNYQIVERRHFNKERKFF
jgi:hypothetical protein